MNKHKRGLLHNTKLKHIKATGLEVSDKSIPPVKTILNKSCQGVPCFAPGP